MPIETVLNRSCNNAVSSTFTSPASKISNIHPNIFVRIKIAVKNVFEAIAASFKKILSWILPRKLSTREQELQKSKKQKVRYQRELRCLDAYSILTLIKIAQKLQPEFDPFLVLANNINEKDKSDGKEIRPQKDLLEIVKEQVNRDAKELKLVLNEFYTRKIEELTEKINNVE